MLNGFEESKWMETILVKGRFFKNLGFLQKSRLSVLTLTFLRFQFLLVLLLLLLLLLLPPPPLLPVGTQR